MARSHPAELAALELLASVAATGSLTASARRSGITQQAASLRIRALERDLGVTVLTRSARGSRLTDAGVLIASWAAPVLEAARHFESAVAALRTGGGVPLEIAASLTVAEHLLPGWLLELRSLEPPQLSVRLTATNSAAVIDLVRQGSHELGFIETPDVPTGLRSRQVTTDQLVVVVRAGHPWTTRRRPVTATELAATPLVVREHGSGTRSALEDALEQHPARLTPVAPAAELPTAAAIRGTVVASDHPAVLSRLAVTEALTARSLAIVAVRDLEIHRPITAVWSADRAPSQPGRSLFHIALAGCSQ